MLAICGGNQSVVENMITKLLFSLPVRRNQFPKTLTHFASNFSILAETSVTDSNTSSENLFLRFVTNRFNISSADAARILKSRPALGRLKSMDNVEQLVYMLNRHGFSEDQIALIIRSQPSLLLTSAEVVASKIQVLKHFGLEVKCISRIPRSLTFKLEILRSNFELLRTVFPTQDILNKAIRNNSWFFTNNWRSTFKPSVAFWENFGFRGAELTKFVCINPSVLACRSLTPEQLDLIGRIGTHKESKMYKYILSILARWPIEVLEAKIHKLQLCGLSPEEALNVVRALPLILTMTEETIKKKLDFMLNRMNLSVDFVTKHPRMFSMSLDKVMGPRFLVLQNMSAMDGGGEVNPTRLFTMLMMNEAKFVVQIIEGHREYAALWTVYKNAIANVSKVQK